MDWRVSETMVFVRSLDEAIRFYTHQVGFKLLERYDWGFAILEMDGQHKLGLMLESAWDREYPDDDTLPKPRVALRTTDLGADVRKLKEAGVHVGPVRETEAGSHSVVFWDEDSNPWFLWSEK